MENAIKNMAIVIQEQYDSNKKMHGLWIGNWGNGNRYYEEMWEHGLYHGVQKLWHNNGQLGVINYHVKDRREGEYIFLPKD
jgi:antitoxin component YwqK of YwqJK toxin-antitoxin module